MLYFKMLVASHHQTLVQHKKEDNTQNLTVQIN